MPDGDVRDRMTWKPGDLKKLEMTPDLYRRLTEQQRRVVDEARRRQGLPPIEL